MSSEEDPAAWLRRRIGERLYLARRTIELGNAAEWTEPSSGVLVTGEPTEADTWHGTWAMGDSSLTWLMEANDPQDTIARCAAELAILDLCMRVADDDEDHESYYSDGWAGLTVARRVLRLIAGAYKHRPGYREEDWKP